MSEADTRILAHSSAIRQVTVDLLKRVPGIRGMSPSQSETARPREQ